MDTRTRCNLWYVLITLWGIILLRSLWMPATQITQTSYSQFQTDLAEGRLKEVRSSQDYLTGTLKDSQTGEPQQFLTVRVEPDLAERLAAHHVEFTGERESTLLRDGLSWIVPVLLFFGLWMVLMRRFAQREGLGGGLMTIGKSTAKISEDLRAIIARSISQLGRESVRGTTVH